MSVEDLENYEVASQLALYREYKDVMALFSYAVETERRFYLTNKVEVTPRPVGDTVYFEVLMTDVWVWDLYRTNRFVKTVRVYAIHDVNIEERLPNQEFSVPDLPAVDALGDVDTLQVPDDLNGLDHLGGTDSQDNPGENTGDFPA